MACPKCGCRVTYYYEPESDYSTGDSELERCSSCAEIFDVEFQADDDDLDLEDYIKEQELLQQNAV